MNIIRAQGSRRRDTMLGAPKLYNPTIPAKAGIQSVDRDPRFRGDNRQEAHGKRIEAQQASDRHALETQPQGHVERNNGSYPASAKGSSPESRMAVSRVVMARGATPSIAFAKASI